MYKTMISSIAVFFLVGCTSEQSISYKSSMFQSVSPKEAVLLQEGTNKSYCGRCGMDLVKFYKTSHAATDEKNVIHQYCSIHCLQEHLNEGTTLKNPQVVDIDTLKFIDATKAYYVVGSKKSGTMSMVSKYAFSKEADAKDFKDKFGGEIMDLYKALNVARKDFKHAK